MRAKVVLAGVATLAVIAGCANQIKQVEPKLELRSAAQHLGEQKQGGFTLKFAGSVDDLIAAAKGEDDDPAALRTLFDTTLTVAYDQGADGPADDRMAVSATIGGVPGTEIRVIDQTLYAKAPVSELVKKFGGGAGDLDAIRDQDKSLGAFFDGGWVSLDAKSLQQGTGLPAADATNAKAAAELKKSAQNLVEGADIVRDQSDDDHLIVTTSTTKAWSELKRLVTAVAGDKMEGLTGEFEDAPKDRPIVLDLWIHDDRLTAAEINILQFADGATGRAAVRLEMTAGGPIEAPQGATAIDPKVLRGLTAGVPTPAGGGSEAFTVANVLGYQAVELAGEDGGRPASHLKEAIGDLAGSPFKARIVRTGVAEVTSGTAKACLTLPSSADGTPKVVEGAC